MPFGTGARSCLWLLCTTCLFLDLSQASPMPDIGPHTTTIGVLPTIQVSETHKGTIQRRNANTDSGDMPDDGLYSSDLEDLLEETGEDCDYGRSFDSLESIQAASDKLSVHCIAMYSLEVLGDMFDTTMDNYTSVNDGYDASFGFYTTYIKELVPDILANQQMFDISATESNDAFAKLGKGMNFFDCQLSDPNKSKFPCSELRAHSKDMVSKGYTATLTLKDADGYGKSLVAAGVVSDWTTFGDYTLSRSLAEGHAGRVYNYKFLGFPIENTTMTVPNPKDVVTKGLGDLGGLRSSLDNTLAEVIMNDWVGGSVQDPVQAYSAPIFLFMQAVDNMAQAKALGKQEEAKEAEEERKRRENLIILIISVILMFVPVVGEELAPLTGIASLARTIAIASEAGNAALAIYDTVQNPESALLNVLGMMVGAGSIAKTSRDGRGIAEVAKIRGAMKPELITSMGRIFKNNDDKLQSLMKSCKWAG